MGILIGVFTGDTIAEQWRTHSRMLPFFRRPRVFYLYCVLAFGAVLFTYFGVNFLLGGMHAYQ